MHRNIVFGPSNKVISLFIISKQFQTKLCDFICLIVFYNSLMSKIVKRPHSKTCVDLTARSKRFYLMKFLSTVHIKSSVLIFINVCDLIAYNEYIYHSIIIRLNSINQEKEMLELCSWFSFFSPLHAISFVKSKICNQKLFCLLVLLKKKT